MGCHSCSITHSGTRSDKDGDTTAVTPKIIFLNYSVKPDKSEGGFEIVLINKLITEGKLKKNNIQPEISKPGDLNCITLDNHLNPVDTIVVPDPLNITVESVNERNELFKKEVKIDSARFSIRLQLTEKIYAIGIKMSTNSKNQNNYLLLTKLK
jgi:hypothetical protein